MTMYAQQNFARAAAGDAASSARNFAVVLVLLGIALAVSIFLALNNLIGILVILIPVLVILVSLLVPVFRQHPGRDAGRE